MKIQPSTSKTNTVAPAVVAVLGSLLASCDRQTLPGDVPQVSANSHMPEPSLKNQPTTPTEEEELPQVLGGDVPYTPDVEDASAPGAE